MSGGSKVRAGLAAAAACLAGVLGLAGCGDETAPEPRWFYITTQESQLPSNNVYGVYVDDRGSWFATDRGLAYNNGTEWAVYGSAQGMPADAVFGVTVCPNGDVWAATIAGAARLRGGAITVFTTGEGLPADRVYGVAFDGAKVWFATAGGLARYDDPGFTVVTSASGLPGDDCRDLYALGPDRLWVACIGGAAFYDGGQVQRYTATGAGLPSDNVYAVAARGEEAWVGTDAGLCRLRAGEVVATYTTGNSGLRNNLLTDLAYGAGGELWAATAGGASRRRDDDFETFTRDDGLLSDYVLAAWPDKYGYVWLGTLGGGVNRYHD